MATRKRILAALLCAMTLALLAVPSAAARTVYFTAVNENVLELKDETMPFWSGQYLYVDGSIFVSEDLPTRAPMKRTDAHGGVMQPRPRFTIMIAAK